MKYEHIKHTFRRDNNSTSSPSLLNSIQAMVLFPLSFVRLLLLIAAGVPVILVGLEGGTEAWGS